MVNSHIDKLQIFISYPGKDGLNHAKTAADILRQLGHNPWVYENHRTLGATVFREIAVRIRKRSDVVIYICTNSSLQSWGQELEAGYALSNRRVKVIVVVLNGAQVPDELTAFNYLPINSQQFQQAITPYFSNLPTIVANIKRLGEDVKVKIN